VDLLPQERNEMFIKSTLLIELIRGF
jgi:hypothetical protein